MKTFEPGGVLRLMAAIGLAASSAALVIAQELPSPPESYDAYSDEGGGRTRDLLSSLTEDIDPFTGNLRVVNRLVRIPGNGGLDLDVLWTQNIQRPDMGGIHFGRIRSSRDCGHNCSEMVLELPDGSMSRLFAVSPKPLNPTRYRARNNWLVERSGNTYEAHAPDGTTLHFRTRSSRTVTIDVKVRPLNPNAPPAAQPPDTLHYSYTAVDRIVDRNGNSIDIDYSDGRPVGVTASDGRTVSLTWDSGRPVSVGAGGRTWQFRYGREGTVRVTTLVLPNGQSWVYRYGEWLNSVTNPYGGVTSYAYGYVDAVGQLAALRRSCNNPDCTRTYDALSGQEANRPAVFRKTTSEGGTWRFGSFAPGADGWSNSPDIGATRGVRVVTLPDGTRVTSDYTTVYEINDMRNGEGARDWRLGLLQKKEIGGLHTETYTWEASSHPSLPRAQVPVLTRKEVRRDGAVYVTRTAYDHCARPTRVVETGEASRTRTFTYAPASVGDWRLAFVTSETLTDGENTSTVARTFDGDGNVVMESTNGVETRYTRHADGSVAGLTDARGVEHLFSDYHRGVARLEVRASGWPEEVSLRRAVDDFGNVTAVTDGRGNTTTYGYDELNRLSDVAPPQGNPTRITWQRNRRTLTRGPLVDEATFDGFGRVVSRRKHDVTVTLRYDALGRATFRSYPNRAVGDSFTYDALGRLRTLTHSDATSRTYTYAAASVSVRNERGHTTLRRYRSYGDPDIVDLVAIVPPRDEAATEIQRNLAGQAVLVAQNGVVRRYEYDDRGYLVGETHPETGITRYERDAVGRVLGRRVGSSPEMRHAYDALGRLTATTYDDGLASDVAYGYDANGNLVRLANGSAVRTYAYDANNNLVQERLAAGGLDLALGYAYDGNDALASMTYPDGLVVDRQPDALGRPTRLGGYVTGITYNGRGQVTAWRDANGRVGAVTYGERGFPSRQTVVAENIALPPEPVPPVPPAAPGAAPQPPSASEPGGNITANGACRALHPEPTFNCNSQCGGAYQEFLNAHNTWQRSYNACVTSWNARGSAWSDGVAGCHYLFPRPSQCNSGCGGLLESWQRQVNACAGDWRARVAAWNSYRAALAAHEAEVAAYHAAVARYQQDLAAHRRAVAAYEAAVRAAGPVLFTNYVFDAVGNLATLEDTAHADYGRRLAYDELDRLVAAEGPWGAGSLGYDGNGNIVSQQYGAYAVTYDYDVDSQKLVGAAASEGQTTATLRYAYDAWGNVVARGPGQAYQYDAAGTLRFLNPNAPGAIAFGYDGAGTRVSIQDASRSVVELTARNGDLVYEVDLATGRATSHIHLGGMRRVDVAGTSVTWYHNDLIGGPLAATGPGGDILWRTHYRPFGARLTSGPATANREWFAGKPYEAAAGLSYFRARWYDPVAGRFTAVDPVPFSTDKVQSFNRFAYANNNPFRYVDPTGMTADEAGAQAVFGPHYGGAIIGGPRESAIAFDAGRYVEGYRTTSLRDALEDGKTAIGIGEAVATYGEFTNVNPFTKSWLGKDGAWHSPDWGGNGAAGGRSLAEGRASAWSEVGKMLGVLGIGIDLAKGALALSEGDGYGAARSGIDAGIGGACLFAGPPGAVIGVAYTALEMTGAREALSNAMIGAFEALGAPVF